MCGIFGLVTTQNSNLTSKDIKNFSRRLFKLSYSRGKEAAGLALDFNDHINVLTQSLPATKFIKTTDFKNLFSQLHSGQSVSFIGHTRLITEGASAIDNQPIIKNSLVGVHNGICVNVKKLWDQNQQLNRQYNVDSEIILGLIYQHLQYTNSITSAVQKTFAAISGASSIAVLFKDYAHLLLATNNGSLYYLNYKHKAKNFFIFASERFILDKFLAAAHLSSGDIRHLEPNTACLLNTHNLKTQLFPLRHQAVPSIQLQKNKPAKKIVDLLRDTHRQIDGKYFDDLQASHDLIEPFAQDYQKNKRRINNLRRCTKCILPETMPFIKFDQRGVCNYCHNYKKNKLKDKQELEKAIAPYRSADGRPDCLVMFSGGRDSSYALHYVRKVLKLNPITYSYDWGMLTDLGRRNQARMCGVLGVEHILLSADIKKKRKNIKKNVLAWLKKPDLGTVPLFMAGDKQYLYYAEKIRRQLGLKVIIFGANPLEVTGFKVAFCGIKPLSYDERSVNINLKNKFQLAWYYLKQFLANPSYINSSLLDTLHGYITYYLVSHRNLSLFDYIKWDENEIDATLKNKYDWEFAPDTKSSWRIGDGTASFYNYIYYTLAGFSENDTFRSNQIREGIITRQQALKLAERDNHPRFNSIYWYCQTINIDFKDTLTKINQTVKLY